MRSFCGIALLVASLCIFNSISGVHAARSDRPDAISSAGGRYCGPLRDGMRQDAAFAGGGATFSANGITQDRNLFNVGAGITFLTCNCARETWTVKALYDYKWNRSDYSANQISVIANLKF